MTEQPTSSASPPALELDRLSKSYPGVQALRDVSFAIAGGEIHALLGENGAGKSTLLKIVSGAVRPDAGRIVLDGTALELHSPLEARNAGIALIHQELALVPHMSAAANIYLGREVTHGGVTLDRTAMEKRAQELVDRLGVLIDVRRPVRTFSMAQRQCIEIARALLFRARVLALDEPTSSLTNRECEALFTILRGSRAEGVAIVYVSHRLEEVALIADRATVMRDGRVVGTKNVAQTTRAELVTMMVGRDLSEMPQSPYHPPEAVALRVQNLSSAARLFDISFEAYRGQVLGIAGLVGSGRTELLRAIFGADPIDRGTIEVNGQPFAQRNNIRGAIGRKIGLIPEDRKGQALFGRMSIRSNMTLASLGRFARGGVIQSKPREAEADQLIADLDLRPRDSARAVGQLSGGNQQKAIIGRWLSAKSDILLIDEPTRGVDVGAKAEIYRLIGTLKGQGAAVVMVSSDLPEVLQISDRIAVMREGRIVKELDRQSASEESIMHYATGGV
jgi:ribose transport system ATP-binding protein